MESDERIAIRAEASASRAPAALGWLGRAPLAVTVLVLVALVAAYLATAAGLGGLAQLVDPSDPSALHPALVFNGVLVLILVFTVWFGLNEPRAVARDLGELRPVLLCSDAEHAQLVRTGREAAAGSPLALLIGAVLGVALHAVGKQISTAQGAQAWGAFHSNWNLLLMGLLFAGMGGRGRASLVTSRLFSALGRQRARVQLLVPASFAPFGRRGLRLASYWFIGSAIASLLFAEPTNAIVVASVIAATLGLGTLSLLLPCQGIHERLREVRCAELARVRELLARQSANVLDRDVAIEDSAPLLASLLAYEARLREGRDWPFDTPTLGRFVLVLLIPLGSWLGGALVERLLDAALG